MEQVQVRSPRDTDEKAVAKDEDGAYSQDTENNMRVKCSEEMRLDLGVAMVELKDGKVEGRQCEIINYKKGWLYLNLKKRDV